MPAKSKAQQSAAAMALSVKRGKIPKSELKGAAKKMLDMSEKELEKFASTNRKDLPKQVKEYKVTKDSEIILDGEHYVLETGDIIQIN